jgi:hypothetical protein
MPLCTVTKGATQVSMLPVNCRFCEQLERGCRVRVLATQLQEPHHIHYRPPGLPRRYLHQLDGDHTQVFRGWTSARVGYEFLVPKDWCIWHSWGDNFSPRMSCKWYVRGGGEGKRRILIGQSVPPIPFGMTFGRLKLSPLSSYKESIRVLLWNLSIFGPVI